MRREENLSPKKILTPIFARKIKGFRKIHKDALGENKKLSKMGSFEGHLEVDALNKLTIHKDFKDRVK